ncbi:hypothetical protein KAFR_0C02440 [Kazachstania africana CBS 2517]|uniref:Uncharacterized protein n=1 Tax=Kazachstania africana (strain ATCC 22294 / BCRC 22015 / CBS 2517 / CECT 1963 / NBRC 1671 / NRRL Y-8276) TaxID=1071382 RepID=H2AS87_KAZAF|nr:hypothetical protein KAFR_0C02440 [Kazachstania africana CBS 2517]CCF57237.1 hypothetical protein KAFR_0C02440 [Kazachstania africana CBS 2517]
MELEETSLQLEQTYEKYVVFILKQIISFLQFSIPLVISFGQRYPYLFLGLTTIFLVYTVWRIVTNIYYIMKKLLLLYLVIVVIFIYLRGVNQFLNYDIPFILHSFPEFKVKYISPLVNNEYLGIIFRYSSTLFKMYLNKLVEIFENM